MTVDCASCGLFSVQGQPEQSVHTNRPGGLAITRQAFDLCRFPAAARILDVACGTGATLNYLSGIPGLTVVGLDRSGNALSKARGEPNNVNLLRGESAGIPLAPGYFDGVFIECAVSLTGDPLNSLLEIKRVLKPYGKVILADIYIRESVSEDNRRVLGGSPCLAGVLTRREIDDLVELAGFKTLTWEDQTPLLKQWMVEQVFRLGSISEFFCQLSGGKSQSKGLADAWSRIRLGYYLAILQKPQMHNTEEFVNG